MAVEESRHEETVQARAEQEQSYKSGLKIFGYIVPWWVIIVVVLLILYVLYDQGHLKSIVGAPEQRVVSLPQTGGFRYDTVGIETPRQMRQLFGYN